MPHGHVACTKDNGEEKTLDKSQKDTITDENGNPIVSTNYLNRQVYRQMREQPKSSWAVVSTSKNHYSFGNTSSSTDVFHRDFHLEPYLPSQQIKDLEDASNSLYDKRKLRKKKHKEKVVHSEDVANYVGTKDIDELVNFIENDGIQREKKLISTSFSNELSTKTEKCNKKTKEKKLKFPETFDFPTENLEIIENHSKDINNSVTNEESKETIELLDFNMGNSLRKADENTQQTEVHEKSVESVLKNGADKIEKMPLIKTEEIKNPKRNGKKESVARVAEPVKRKSLIDIEKRVKITKESEIFISKSNSAKCRESSDIMNNKEMANNKICSLDLEDMDTATDSVKNHELKIENKHKEVHLVQVEVQELKNENNIKHHNAKNSKTEKGFMSHISNDVKTKLSKAEDTVTPTEEISAYYIFTDVDVIPPVEHEFTVVSKKKKHVPVIKKQVAMPREFPVINKIVHPHEKQVAPARSVTPPSTSNFVANNEESRLRDLSPSAFPALRSNSKGRQSGLDGRRNSTGDVPSETSLKVQDDSDIESVKSLPVSQAGTGNHCPAPNMPATYAKIAASPKQKDALKMGSKTILRPSSPSEDDNAKLTLWKGNTTERRHSVGSSPEDVHISVEQTVQSSLQKGIGQELVLPEVQVCATRPSTNAVVKLGHNKVQRNDYLNESPFIDKVVADNVCSEKNETIEPKNTVVVSTIAGRDSLNALPQRAKSKMSKKERTNSPHSKIQNNGKKLKIQSVIFLDKRVESVPQNFEISFGFDESAEPQHNENVITVNPNTNSHGSVKSERLAASSSVSTNKMVSSNSSTSSTPSASSTVNGENVENKKVSTVICSNKLLSDNSSIKHIHLAKDGTSKKWPTVPGMNGVVQPNLHDRPKLAHHRSKLVTDKTQISNSVPTTKDNLSHKALSSSSSSESNKVVASNIGNVIVEYGNGDWSSLHKETSSTRMSSNQHKKTCKKIEFVPESASNHERFNVGEAVGFLQREWDKVKDMKDRDPSCVVMYSKQ